MEPRQAVWLTQKLSTSIAFNCGKSSVGQCCIEKMCQRGAELIDWTDALKSI